MRQTRKMNKKERKKKTQSEATCHVRHIPQRGQVLLGPGRQRRRVIHNRHLAAQTGAKFRRRLNRAVPAEEVCAMREGKKKTYIPGIRGDKKKSAKSGPIRLVHKKEVHPGCSGLE